VARTVVSEAGSEPVRRFADKSVRATRTVQVQMLESMESKFAGEAPAPHLMPLYEYQCQKCGHRFERIQRFSDAMVKKCPECGGKVEQMISAPAVQFKGSGWYVTDYAKKSSGASSSKSDSDGKADSSKDSGAKDQDSTSKKESKSKAESASKSSDKK
jgi:putative FmdB family regulatory protein